MGGHGLGITDTEALRTAGFANASRAYVRAGVGDAAAAGLCRTGGLTEGREAAAMADARHRPFAPHGCIGPVGFVAGVHASCPPNTLIRGSVRAFGAGWHGGLVTGMPVIRDGWALPMRGPELGKDLLPVVSGRADLTVRRPEA